MTRPKALLKLPRVPAPPSEWTGDLANWARAVTDGFNSALSHLRVAGSSVASINMRGDPVVSLNGGDPKLFAYNSTATVANEGFWDETWGGNGGNGGLLFRTRNDADDNGETWLKVTRSGASVTGVLFPTTAKLSVSASSINLAEAGAGGGLAGNATGTAGDIAWGSSSNVSYLYVCVSTNSWMRAALSPF